MIELVLCSFSERGLNENQEYEELIFLEPERGIEPPTQCLQNTCSAIELLRRVLFDYKGYSRKIEALGLIRKNPEATQDLF